MATLQIADLHVLTVVDSITTSLLPGMFVGNMNILSFSQKVGLRTLSSTCPSRVLTIPKREKVLSVNNCTVRG